MNAATTSTVMNTSKNAWMQKHQLSAEEARNLRVKKLEVALTEAYKEDPVKPVWTPYALAQEMLSSVDISGKSILVLSDLGFILPLKDKGADMSKITFVAHTPEQEKLATQMRIGKVLQVGYNNSIEELEQQLMGLKFDVVVGNPPYGNLHLPILKKVVEHLADDGISITVQPARWLQDPLWPMKKANDAKRLRSTFEGKIDDIKIVSGKEATRIFGVDMGFDLGIFTIKKAGGRFDYESLTRTVNGVNVESLRRLLVKNTMHLGSYDGSQKHFVPVKTIAAAGSGRGFVGEFDIHQVYGFFADGKSNACKYGNGLDLASAHRANSRRTSGKTIGAPIVEFTSPEEAKHFYEYIKLDAFRFFVFTTTVDVHIHCRFLPCPSESDAFKTPWTQERFFNYFGITPAEQELIANIMKNAPRA
jgi:hypothetical protein